MGNKNSRYQQSVPQSPVVKSQLQNNSNSDPKLSIAAPNISSENLSALQDQLSSVKVTSSPGGTSSLLKCITSIIGGPAGIVIAGGVKAIKFAHSMLISGTMKDPAVCAALKEFLPEAYNLQDIVKKLIKVYQTVEGLIINLLD
jgi:hypothetical protein